MSNNSCKTAFRKKKKEVVLCLLAHVTRSIFFSRILWSEVLVYIHMFFRTAVQRKLFDIRFSYKHCNFLSVCLGPLLNLHEINLSWKEHSVEYWLGLGKEHLGILKP